jgi:hypothetical protein
MPELLGPHEPKLLYQLSGAGKDVTTVTWRLRKQFGTSPTRVIAVTVSPVGRMGR